MAQQRDGRLWGAKRLDVSGRAIHSEASNQGWRDFERFQVLSEQPFGWEFDNWENVAVRR